VESLALSSEVPHGSVCFLAELGRLCRVTPRQTDHVPIHVPQHRHK